MVSLLLTGFTVSVSIKVEWGLWTGLLPGQLPGRLWQWEPGTLKFFVMLRVSPEPCTAEPLSLKSPQSSPFPFKVTRRPALPQISTAEILVLSLEEGLRLRDQRKLISLSFKETLSVKL